MRINKVIINNFRNIQHSEYDLERINLFTGPNQTGKTNTILAIYWAMTDFLMDGSTDYPSFKPSSDTKAEVSVELQFDSFTLKKTYAEKWTKTRGSEEMTMTGHTTTYWIDGVKLKISEAKKEIYSRLGISGFDFGNFDLLRGITDPYYFAETTDWKTLRNFVIELCGDVSNDEIFSSNPLLEQIRDRLETDGFDTARTTKFFKSELKRVNEGIKEDEGKEKGLKEMACPSKSDIDHATEEIESLKKELETLNSNDSYGKVSDEMKLKIREKEADLKTLIASEREEIEKHNAAVNDEIKKKQEALFAYTQEINDFKMRELSPIDSKKADIQIQILEKQREIERAEGERKIALAQYHQLADNWEPPVGKKCPNCGFQLDQEYIDAAIAKHDEDIKEIIRKGKDLNVQIEEKTIAIEELKQEKHSLDIKYAEMSDKFAAMKKKVSPMESEISSIKKNLRSYMESEEACRRREEVERLKSQLRDLALNFEGGYSEISDRTARINEQIEFNQQVLNQKIAYDLSQEKIAKIEENIAFSRKKAAEIEQKIMLVELFVQTKLKSFEQHISSVFGSKMKFTLIQENIKEGSYQEVCTPSVLNKDTPFENGSGSEKIIAGIYFSECVKKKLGLPDLPFIFDECDKLDGAHLATIDTDAQMISTIVNDTNYSDITLVTRD